MKPPFFGSGIVWGLLALLTLGLTGCLGARTVAVKGADHPAAQRADLSNIPAPWRGPAAKLAQRGFTQAQLEGVFRSPNLTYTSTPMAAKLKELHGIYFRSELTREIQENLYQLGYDLHLDGRSGSGTRAAVSRFQRDNGLAVTGEVSDATLAATKKALKTKKTRPLSSYTPPPAAKPSRSATYPHFTKTESLAKIAAYYKADRDIFDRMSRRYQVPGEVAAAIMWVETGYGQFFGKHKAASNLASMAAAASDFKVVEPALGELPQDAETKKFLRETAEKRGEWALNELAALMTYSFANGHDPTAFPGSIYGALGWGQFMPTSILKYAADGNGDGRVDVFDKTDAVFSIGNYLKAHGWRGARVDSLKEEDRREVIMKYNKSGVYVNTVLYVADYLAKTVR